MKAITNNQSLNEAIILLEQKRQSDLYLLKEQFDFAKQQLNPVHMIKEEFNDAISSPDLKGKLVKGAVGLLSGFLAKRFVVGSGAGLVAKIAGPVVQAGVTGLVMKKIPNSTGSLKDDGISLLQKGLDKIKIK
ncbi:hypothetical protein [Flavobacterium caeni]|uniref:Uncharacterized protein n=1 Tax=Flavobacterium caeni TaxID=490189 RepID=A0A1G5CIH4_9FLAO|nr:hypothetical protein [Flavobacterium caeni]SCY02118.1 hypothetical protein SAMN02927903_00548 [Flavobacterium caeni]